MIHPHFALGAGDKVTVWGSVTTFDGQGGRHFDCLNGAWSGYLSADGMVYVEGDKTGRPGTVVWEGTVPRDKSHYNEAIPWIMEQIAGGAA